MTIKRRGLVDRINRELADQGSVLKYLRGRGCYAVLSEHGPARVGVDLAVLGARVLDGTVVAVEDGYELGPDALHRTIMEAFGRFATAMQKKTPS